MVQRRTNDAVSSWSWTARMWWLNLIVRNLYGKCGFSLLRNLGRTYLILTWFSMSRVQAFALHESIHFCLFPSLWIIREIRLFGTWSPSTCHRSRYYLKLDSLAAITNLSSVLQYSLHHSGVLRDDLFSWLNFTSLRLVATSLFFHEKAHGWTNISW
jgi:hypothetical protein